MNTKGVTSSYSLRSRALLYSATMLFLSALVVLLWSAGQSQAENAPVTPTPDAVSTGTIHIQTGFEVPVKLRGLIESAQDARIGFDVAGEVEAVLVEEGDTVSQGQILATLDTARLNARKKELQASLVRANAESELTALTYQRIDKLVRQNLESSQRRDEADAQWRAAKARVDEVAAALASLDVEIAKTRLVAPFDGRITARFMDEGTVVNAGTAVVALTNTQQLQARFAMPASDIDRFQAGQRVSVSVGGQTYEATVTQRLSLRSTQTRTVDMLVTLSGAGDVKPGDMATLEVWHARPEQGAWLPVSALSNGLRGLWTVFVAEQNGADTVLNARTVEVVYSDENRVFVRGALREGERFVKGGTHKLSPGQHVAVMSSGTDR
ncbi:efflux RND transporter periplasmic adaptor subunit [Alteromonas sp. CYL-A6]|uniref:efflux RND transporter periplasmic adaptor subunit n=1 Tax=Alteromonas nitratireducens TaxID=3390813 RepID=UPI0034AF1983